MRQCAERTSGPLHGRKSAETLVLCGAGECAALVIIVRIDAEMLGAHFNEHLHKLGLRFVGKLGDLTQQRADSDDVARSFRDHVARCSDMMSPA